MGEPILYWVFSCSFVLALTLHLVASLLIGVWWFWREELLVDWHGRLMIAALSCGISGALASLWLPPG